jgi:hypothetical protein
MRARVQQQAQVAVASQNSTYFDPLASQLNDTLLIEQPFLPMICWKSTMTRASGTPIAPSLAQVKPRPVSVRFWL